MRDLEGAIDREELQTISAHLDDSGIVDNPMPASGHTPLFYAALRGRFEVCRHLISSLGASVFARDRAGRTALMEMIRCRGKQWPKAIAELLKGSVNEQDASGMTALMFACQGAGAFGSRKGNLAIISQLIELGADTGLRNKRGQTAVGVAEAENSVSKSSANSEVVSYLQSVAIEQRAISEFLAKYRCSFDSNGVLVLSPK